MVRLLSFLAFVICSLSVYPFSGSWRGDLNVGMSKIPLVFNFTEEKDGKTSCTLDSPLQNVTGMSGEILSLDNDSISIRFNKINATFSGVIQDNNTIKGSFTQAAYILPLTLSPELPLLERRPQTPQPPFPYSVTDHLILSFDGAGLAASLTMPDDKNLKNIPLVVMVSGSGPQNRDEEIFGHKPFEVIADYLARHGIASLRYDDRGFGESEGDFGSSTTYDFKKDAEHVLYFAKSIDRIGKVGFLGHSEGGSIALMSAAENIPDFVISLAGMVDSGKNTMLRQNRHSMERMGLLQAQVDEYVDFIEYLFGLMEDEGKTASRKQIDVVALARERGLTPTPVLMQSLKNNIDKRTIWFDTFLSVDPSSVISKISCPVLALNGTKDTQVDSSSNLPIIRDSVASAIIYELEGLNHLFQHAETGEITEYEGIRETISPDVLELISAWISKL